MRRRQPFDLSRQIIDEDEKQDRIDAGGVRHHYTMELDKGE